MKPKLTIGYLPVLDHLVLGVAEHNDTSYFESFDLETKLFFNWEKMCDDLKSGVIDGTFLLFPLAMELFREGTDIQVVLLGHREGQIMMVKDEIHSPKDLKGKTVFLPHKYSVHTVVLDRMLKEAGLDPKHDVNYQVGFDDVREIPHLLESGRLDAFLSAEPWGTIAHKDKTGRLMAVSHDFKMHHMCCVLVMRREIIETRPDACEELVRSIVRAGMFVTASPRQAAEIGESFLQCPKKILLEALTHNRGHVLFWDLLPRLEDFKEFQEAAIRELGLWDAPIDLERFVYPRFAQEAYREWMIDVRKEVKDKGEERTVPRGFRESARRFESLWNENIPTVGIKSIETGERYPKDIVREKIDELLGFDFFEGIFEGKECILDLAVGSKKGVAFIQPQRDIEPDRILIRVKPAQAQTIARVLSFGGKPEPFKPAREEMLQKDLLESNQEIIMRQKDDEEVWLSLGFKTFRLLPVMMNLFE